MRLKFLKNILSITFLISMPCIVASAQADKSNVSMYTLGLSPYGFIDKSGKSNGALYELLNEVMHESGVGDYNEILPAKRLIVRTELPKGMCTIVLNTPYVLTKMKLKMIERTGFRLSVGIIPKKGVQLDDYSVLRDIVIALPRGVNVGERFANDKTLTIAHTSKYLSAMLMLKAGRVDAIAGVLQSLEYVARNEGMGPETFGKPLIFSDNEMNLSCNATVSINAQNKLRKAMKKLRENGKVQKIIDGYFESVVII